MSKTYESVAEVTKALAAGTVTADEATKLIDGLMKGTKRAGGKAKTVCPLTRAEFLAKAKPVEVVIGGVPMLAEPREFAGKGDAKGSLGWYVGGKITLKVGDKTVTVQAGLPLTIVNSKEAAD